MEPTAAADSIAAMAAMKRIWMVVAVAFACAMAFGGAPDRLSDQEFWKFITDSSEPGGYFRNADITNITSNEMLYQRVLTDLLKRTKPGGI
jgi:hypothetical protein